MNKNKSFDLQKVLLITSLFLVIVVGISLYTSVSSPALSQISSQVLSGETLTLNEAKSLYKEMTLEEQQTVQGCVEEEMGYDGLEEVIGEVEQRRIEETTYYTVVSCLQDVKNSQHEAETFLDDYKGQVVKPAVRNPDKWMNARCNDGSPFAFKIEKPRKINRTDNWVIYFKGGGMCDDNALSCAERSKGAPERVTTLPENDGHEFQIISNLGIFNHDPSINPEFYNANKVYAHYCSSDLWSGSTNTLHKTSAGKWYFSGRTNARAMFEILKDRFGLDDSNPNTKILLTGGSAGCIGADVNAEQAVEYFPQTAEAGRLKVVSDGCFNPDYDNPAHRLADSNDSLREVLIKGYDFWESKINSLCEANQAVNGQKPGNCFMGSTLYPYLTECGENGLCLPNLVQYSSIDLWAVNAHKIDPKASPTNLALEEWRNVVLTELSNDKINWLFSGGEKAYHTLLMRDSVWKYGPNEGPSLGALLNSFWKDGAPKRVIFGNP
jgi:hypothetical protein